METKHYIAIGLYLFAAYELLWRDPGTGYSPVGLMFGTGGGNQSLTTVVGLESQSGQLYLGLAALAGGFFAHKYV